MNWKKKSWKEEKEWQPNTATQSSLTCLFKINNLIVGFTTNFYKKKNTKLKKKKNPEALTLAAFSWLKAVILLT